MNPVAFFLTLNLVMTPGTLLSDGEAERVAGKYIPAKRMILRAVRLIEASKPADPGKLAAAYNYLALVNNNLGEYAASEQSARKAIELAGKANLSKENIAMHSVVLANALRQQGKYRDAEKILLEAIPTLRKDGTNQALLGTAINNLGALYFWLGDYQKALPILQEGLAIRLAAVGSDQPDVANSYLDIGSTEFRLGDIDAAIEDVSNAIAIRTAKLGSAHPETLAAKATLGVILESKGRTDEAMEILKQVVADARTALGQAHPELAQYEDDYASVLASKKSFAEARKVEAESLAIRARVFGKTSREYASGLRSLAQIESAAQPGAPIVGSTLTQSAAIYKSAGQTPDPDYADTLDDLGAFYVTSGDLQAARQSYTEAVSARKGAAPTIAVAISLANLSDVLFRMNLKNESADALKQAKAAIDALPEGQKDNADCEAILQRFEALVQP